MTEPLARPRRERMIAGVCAGIARRYGWPTRRVRLLFVIFGLFGAGELAYIALWLLMPKAD